jgi:protein-tyrosine phosphatase
MKKILFICTGNYYRSRFAEAIFNHYATKKKLPWRAFSRGLATWMVAPENGVIAHEVRELMKERGIPESHTGAAPTPLTSDDLAAADRIIALKDDEHRPMMLKQFPEWAPRIDYWSVHDIDQTSPAEALPDIEKKILALIDTLSA